MLDGSSEPGATVVPAGGPSLTTGAAGGGVGIALAAAGSVMTTTGVPATTGDEEASLASSPDGSLLVEKPN